MIKYTSILLLFFNVLVNNAFILTQINKIYFANTKHIRKYNILLNNIPNNIPNNTINSSYSALNEDFPSFYEFLRIHSNQESEENEESEEIDNVEIIKADFINFKDNIDNIDNIKDNNTVKNFAMTLSSKNLKLLTAFSAIHWSRTWIYEMININEFFPTFMYQDMYRMCDFGCVNVSKRYFYIGYYPPSFDSRKGPYYIGAFEVNPIEREFIARIIIQNPYYCSNNLYDKEKIINFRKELEALCHKATVNFKYSNLKNTPLERYYFSWLYND